MAVSVKMSKKHQITIPSEVRRQLGSKSGDELLVGLRRAAARTPRLQLRTRSRSG